MVIVAATVMVPDLVKVSVMFMVVVMAMVTVAVEVIAT